MIPEGIVLRAAERVRDRPIAVFLALCENCRQRATALVMKKAIGGFEWPVMGAQTLLQGLNENGAYELRTI